MVRSTAAAGSGGPGLGYAVSKGALHRVAGVLAHEIAGTGVSVVNVSPGFVATERIAIDMAEFGFDASKGASPDLIGRVVAWFATTADAAEWNGRTLDAQEQARELGYV
ncbi:MAG: SDR family NAD(P)-dependent oxidoreductase [Actinomycetota bacterium]|nr:SDR family NAD(P)-dependent oxidoreductase [Actinomycetota bacterium]